MTSQCHPAVCMCVGAHASNFWSVPQGQCLSRTSLSSPRVDQACPTSLPHTCPSHPRPSACPWGRCVRRCLQTPSVFPGEQKTLTPTRGPLVHTCLCLFLLLAALTTPGDPGQQRWGGSGLGQVRSEHPGALRLERWADASTWCALHFTRIGWGGALRCWPSWCPRSTSGRPSAWYTGQAAGARHRDRCPTT